jgi:hypothetical protein
MRRGWGRTSLVLRNDPAELPRLIAWAERFACRHALPALERARLSIILEELFTNAVKHGYDDLAPSGRIEVALALDAGQLLTEFNDDGRPFDPYVDGALLARVSRPVLDQIACVHMSGLLSRSLVNAGQDGLRDTSSKHCCDRQRPMDQAECLVSWIERSHHLLVFLQVLASAQHGCS